MSQRSQLLWNGTPIVYAHCTTVLQHSEDHTVFIPCNDYVTESGDLRYVAVSQGQLVAVELRKNQSPSFCSFFNDPLFEGHLMLLAPYYDTHNGKQVYVIPFVNEADFN